MTIWMNDWMNECLNLYHSFAHDTIKNMNTGLSQRLFSEHAINNSSNKWRLNNNNLVIP